MPPSWCYAQGVVWGLEDPGPVEAGAVAEVILDPVGIGLVASPEEAKPQAL